MHQLQNRCHILIATCIHWHNVLKNKNKEKKCIVLNLHRNHSYLKELKCMEFKIVQLIVLCRK